jgi:hypothetical protein
MYKRYNKIPFWHGSDWFKYLETKLRLAEKNTMITTR